MKCSRSCCNCSQGTADCEDLKAMVRKLAEYEDLEEQGKLLKLPCKVGDYVYVIKNDEILKDVIEDYDIWSIRDGIKLRTQLRDFNSYVIAEIGKTAFLTEEEADAALRKMEGENDKK